jgi:hypothetical protein
MRTAIDRPITAHEAAVLQWLLDHAAKGDVAAYRLRPVLELHVVGGCDCGCCSLFFQTGKGDLPMIADAMAIYPDGQQANLILWGRGGEIAWLEVCDLDPRLPHRVPEIANLRTFEQRGQELL